MNVRRGNRALNAAWLLVRLDSLCLWLDPEPIGQAPDSFKAGGQWRST
jgi:hypothetical protein